MIEGLVADFTGATVRILQHICASERNIWCKMSQARRITASQRSLLRHLAAASSGRGGTGESCLPEHTAADLAKRLGRREDTVATSLKRLPGEWVAFRKDPRETRTGRGVPAGYWSLTPEGLRCLEQLAVDEYERAANRREDDADASRWVIQRHQAVVTADVTSKQVPELLDVLAGAQQAVDASFIARIDGERHRYLFAFDPALGARPAEALSAALLAAELPFELGTVADVRDAGAMIRDAVAATSAANTARARRSK